MLANDDHMNNKNENYEYSIDQNSKYFSEILNYLITGKINLKERPVHEIMNLKEEFDYFSIDFPVRKLEWDV